MIPYGAAVLEALLVVNFALRAVAVLLWRRSATEPAIVIPTPAFETAASSDSGLSPPDRRSMRTAHRRSPGRRRPSPNVNGLTPRRTPPWLASGPRLNLG